MAVVAIPAAAVASSPFFVSPISRSTRRIPTIPGTNNHTIVSCFSLSLSHSAVFSSLRGPHFIFFFPVEKSGLPHKTDSNLDDPSQTTTGGGDWIRCCYTEKLTVSSLQILLSSLLESTLKSFLLTNLFAQDSRVILLYTGAELFPYSRYFKYCSTLSLSFLLLLFGVGGVRARAPRVVPSSSSPRVSGTKGPLRVCVQGT